MWIPENVMTNNPGTLKITKAKFYRASGRSTQLNGVASDIVLPSKWNYAKDIGEAALESALPYDTVKSARFEKFNYVQPYLSNLIAQSSQRIATNQEYIYIREDIEQFRKYQALNAVSLNEKKRVQEWEEDDARQRARDKERLARKAVAPVVYELSLKQVDLPGLPAPVAKTNAEVAKVEGETLGEDETAEEAPPVVDAALEETERIMADYINQLAVNGVFAKTR
jgi:carboxyl-terminal processing protease